MPVTLRDIAKHLGISHATVSFVLNNRMDMGITEATRQRVFIAAQELGYKPNRAARALTTGRNEMIAVCVPTSRDPYYSALLYGLQDAMREGPYEVVLWQSFGESTKNPSELNVDGFLALDNELSERAFQSEEGVRKPAVSVGSLPKEGWDNVLIDSSKAFGDAVQFLGEKGCKRIVSLGSEESGLAQIQCNPYDRGEAVEATKKHLSGKAPADGIICASDGLAVAARKAIMELGLSLESVFVVGQGGSVESEFAWPPMPTIKHPVEQICKSAWSLLERRLTSHDGDPRTEMISATFVA